MNFGSVPTRDERDAHKRINAMHCFGDNTDENERIYDTKNPHGGSYNSYAKRRVYNADDVNDILNQG